MAPAAEVPAVPAAAPPPTPAAAPTPPKGQPAAAAPGVIPVDLKEREETVLRWLTDLLAKAKSESFDPALLLREAQDLTRQLHEERTRRRGLEEELEHVKKGSVAVIKYVRNREARAREEAIAARDAELSEVKRQLESAKAAVGPSDASQKLLAERDQRIHTLESELADSKEAAGTSTHAQQEIQARFQEELQANTKTWEAKEAELRRQVITLEESNQNLKAEQELAAKQAALQKLDTKNLNAELKARIEASAAKEKELSQKANELKAKLQELMVRADEVERKRAPLEFRERELITREEEMRLRENTLKAQMRQLEEDRKSGVSPETGEKTRRLEALKDEITKKEEELKLRESVVRQRIEALENKERQVTEADVARAAEELKEEVKADRVKTGVTRLDDLLYGGVPLGTNILVNGPAHTGKEILARLLAAEGLKKGVPVLWILSDKATTTVREEMTNILPAYQDYEKKGLVRYVDLYSMSLGISASDPLVTMLSPDEKGFLENLSKAVDDLAAEFRKTSQYYRLLFESVSTVTAYLDVGSTFRFLQPFAGKRKRDRALSYYLVDAGMHSEADLQLLEHMMDGSVNLKVDQLKTYLSVKGIGDVQSRAWIAYTFTKKVFNIGSFSLDHIR